MGGDIVLYRCIKQLWVVIFLIRSRWLPRASGTTKSHLCGNMCVVMGTVDAGRPPRWWMVVAKVAGGG